MMTCVMGMPIIPNTYKMDQNFPRLSQGIVSLTLMMPF